MMNATKVNSKNTVMRRVKYLTLMQIGDKVRGIKTGGSKKLVSSVCLKLLLFAIATAIFFAIFLLLKGLFSFKLSKELFVSVIFVVQVLSVISCLSGMVLVLFVSKENNMLLAFPCNYSEIFLSKITHLFISFLSFFLLFTHCATNNSSTRY